MKNKTWLILIVLVLFTISCALDSQNTLKRAEEWAVTQTADAELYKSLTSGATPEPDSQPEATAESVSQSGSSAPPETSNISDDMVEYEVSATNYGCTCTVSGNMMIALDIQDDKLFFNLPDGTSNEFVKVGPNTYKRSYMGYYILVDSETGEETRVDEERHDVIILTEDGFISEYYQGTEGSPCCFHTYTRAGTTP